MIRVGILGATGYAALELIKILLRHPEAEISVLTSRQGGRPHVAMVHPQLAGRLDLCLEDMGPIAVAAKPIAFLVVCPAACRARWCLICSMPAPA